jgi:hypothetical protein
VQIAAGPWIAGLFCSREICGIKAGLCDEGGPAMKRWIGAAMLTALVAAGSVGTIDMASAAKIITAPQFRAADAAELNAQRRRVVRDDRSYDQPTAGGWTYYYGRPYFYAPAPFPFGFDFGFGW